MSEHKDTQKREKDCKECKCGENCRKKKKEGPFHELPSSGVKKTIERARVHALRVKAQ